MGGKKTCPLPEDSVLASVRVALRDAAQWAEIVDDDWRCGYNPSAIAVCEV